MFVISILVSYAVWKSFIIDMCRGDIYVYVDYIKRSTLNSSLPWTQFTKDGCITGKLVVYIKWSFTSQISVVFNVRW